MIVLAVLPSKPRPVAKRVALSQVTGTTKVPSLVGPSRAAGRLPESSLDRLETFTACQPECSVSCYVGLSAHFHLLGVD